MAGGMQRTAYSYSIIVYESARVANVSRGGVMDHGSQMIVLRVNSKQMSGEQR